MKRAKRIYILLIVLAAIIVAIIVVSRYQRHVEQIKSTKEVILDIDSEEVTGLSWDAEEYSYAFHRDDGWKYDEDENFPVSDEKIDELLDIFSDYEADFEIEDVTDYGQYGLDDPVATIRITTEDGTDEITLGDFSTLDQERYLCLNGGNVYLAETDPLESFEVELVDLMQQDTLDAFTQADTITFEGLEDYGIYYEADSDNSYDPEDVYFVSGSDKPLDTDNVQTYLTNLRNITLYDYAAYDVTEEELEQYGFNDPVITVTVEYPDTDEDGEEITKSVTLTVAEDQEELAALEDGEEDTDVSKYVRVDESQIIYDLSALDYNYLTAASYDDLRHAEILTVDFDEVTQIDIALDDAVYTIYAEEETPEDEDAETVVHYYYFGDAEPADTEEPEEDEAAGADVTEEEEAAGADVTEEEEAAEADVTEVDIIEFSELLSAITAVDFTDEEPTGPEEIGLTVYLDNDRYPEVMMQLYRYDGTYCLAVLDGEPVALVERSAVVDLIEAVYGIVL